MPWFDRWLKGLDDSVDEQPPVRIFTMGENNWHDEADWPLPQTRYLEWYIHSGGAAKTLHGDGTLSTDEPGEEPADTYTYDPGDPVPTEGGNLLMSGQVHLFKPGPRDQRGIESRKDVLCYTSETLTAPIEVSGPVKAVLWAASDAPDTDFVVRLVDVHPDGFAQNLCDGVIRARYRNSPTDEEMLEPGKAYEFTIDMWATSNTFMPGHRIRLDITSSCFPRWDRNANSGLPIGTDDKLFVARQAVLHDAAHKSRVVLPVIPR